MEKQIIVKIKPDGTLVIEAIGYTGAACQEATRRLQEALGTVAEVTLKSEYYEEEITADDQIQLGGGY